MQQRVRLEGPALHQQRDPVSLHAAEPARVAQFQVAPGNVHAEHPGAAHGCPVRRVHDVNLPVKLSKRGKKSTGVLKVTASAKAPKPTKPPTDKDTYVMKCVPGCMR